MAWKFEDLMESQDDTRDSGPLAILHLKFDVEEANLARLVFGYLLDGPDMGRVVCDPRVLFVVEGE